MTFRHSRVMALLGAAAGATLSHGPASAQSASEPIVLSEVVVTALRREQRLQDVPAAITALDPDQLKAKDAQDFRDYVTTVPSVNYSENNFRGIRVTIRGISDGIGTTDPLTGIYIDETPVTETYTATLDPDIYDVERVEVLKGPQGTLYGSGSMGGTVRIITKRPKLNAFEASIDGTGSAISQGDWNRRVDGMINVPVLDDRMALRVSAGYRKDGGWIDDLPRNDKDANTTEKKNARAQLLLKTGDDTSVIFGVLYQREQFGLPWFDDLSVPDYESDRIFRQGGASEARLYSLTVRHDRDWMTLTSASNYLVKDDSNTYDVSTSLRPLLGRILGVSLGPTEGIGLSSAAHVKLFTQEVRLASAGHNRVDWLIGAFYSDGNTDFPQSGDVSQAPTVQPVLSGEGLLSGQQRFTTRQIATFGELTYNVTEHLSATAGVRVFEVQQLNHAVNSGLLNGGTTTTSDQQANLSSSTKKALVKYQFNQDHMAYAQAAQGYRNGGPNGNVPQSVCGAALAAAGYGNTPIPSAYQADKLWNYEVGSKNTLANGRLQLNGDVFYINWSDMQSYVGLSCGSSFVVNAGKAVSKGAELETAFEPINGLTLTGSASYINARLTQVAPGIVAHQGDRLPLTAKWSWNFSGQYEHGLGNTFTGFLRGELNHVGDRWNVFEGQGSARAALMPSYTTLGARLGVRTDRWSVALFGNNLTDKRIVNNINLPVYELVGRPRTVGLNASVIF